MLQELATALIALLAGLYAFWRLMPAAWRRSLATRLGRPAPSPGCGEGCAGCATPDDAPAAMPSTKPVRIYRKAG